MSMFLQVSQFHLVGRLLCTYGKFKDANMHRTRIICKNIRNIQSKANTCYDIYGVSGTSAYVPFF